MELPYKVDVVGNEYYKTKDGYRVEDTYGNILWYDKKGRHHRTDGPASEYAVGYKEWSVNGIKMSEEGFNKWRAKHNPIKESRADIIKQLASMELPYKVDVVGNEYYKTKDGYRVEYVDGYKAWYNTNGRPHRLDGPAEEYANGNKAWYVDGEPHRIDGPAFEWSDGHKEWWVEGGLHRLDGPAIENVDGTKEWWVNGEQLTEKEFNQWRAKHNPGV